MSDQADSERRRSPRDVGVPGNEAILDAYSMAVINVVESVSPAVVSTYGRAADAAKGSGSGFIVTADGYAVTNSHVVNGRQRLLAETNEGDRVDVEVIGDDRPQISLYKNWPPETCPTSPSPIQLSCELASYHRHGQARSVCNQRYPLELSAPLAAACAVAQAA